MTARGGTATPGDRTTDPGHELLDAVAEQLVTDHLGIAYGLADRYATADTHRDLLQVAAVALVGAAHRYDPDHAGSFESYAVTSVLGALRNHLRDATGAVRVPRAVRDRAAEAREVRAELERGGASMPTDGDVATVLGVDTDEVGVARRATAQPATYPTPEDAAAVERTDDLPTAWEGEHDDAIRAVEDHEALRAALAALDATDRDLLRRRFLHDRTQAEIADELGVSQVQVSRRLRATYGELRAVLTDADEGS